MPLRYLVDFHTQKIEKKLWDVIIIGSGIAGLYAAINLDPKLSVCIISKETMDDNNSYLAQGGIAAAVGEGDMPAYHFEDTINAGAGMCNEEAVTVLVQEAPEDIKTLCSIGTNFDRNPDGTLLTTREGGHRRFRIVHALGDATGKEVVDSLLRECRQRSNITIVENCFAIDLLTCENKCLGILATSNDSECLSTITAMYSKKVICASGGIGQVYRSTTNSDVITGDGIAMAYRAGAKLSDMEFVQFHPTAFYNENESEGKSFLISEAVRGEGGILRNISGERFMHRYNEMGEIAPRDIVSRAIFQEMRKTKSNFVYLDITHREPEYLKKRFPTIYEKCLESGIDITKAYIPVCPVQHYFMGGIYTDLLGRTSIEGLYACGESANTGVHGANRLASNSLLEGLVFGRRCAADINSSIDNAEVNTKDLCWEGAWKEEKLDHDAIRAVIRAEMDINAGIERNKKDMISALERVEHFIDQLEAVKVESCRMMETLNIAYLAKLILNYAIERTKSCGSHYRID